MTVDMSSFGLPPMSEQCAAEVKRYLAEKVAAAEGLTREPSAIKNFLDENVLPALREFFAEPSDLETTLDVCLSLFTEGLVARSVELCAEAFKLASNPLQEERALSHAQGMIGQLCRANRFIEVQQLHASALATSDCAKESVNYTDKWVGVAWMAAAGEAHSAGRLDQALAAYGHAEPLLADVKTSATDLAHCLHGRAVVLGEMDSHAQAVVQYQTADKTYRTLGPAAQRSLAECLFGLSVSLDALGRASEALEAKRESDELSADQTQNLLTNVPQQAAFLEATDALFSDSNLLRVSNIQGESQATPRNR